MDACPDLTHTGTIRARTVGPLSVLPIPLPLARPELLQAGTFCNGKSDGFYNYPGDCSKYYQCWGGITYPMSCSAGADSLSHWRYIPAQFIEIVRATHY